MTDEEILILFVAALKWILKLSYEFILHVLKSIFDEWYKGRKKKRKRKKKR